MNVQQQMIFLFSALGAVNGFALALYFMLIKAKRSTSDYFLGGLLFMISLRILKSAFLYFNHHLFQPFVHLGLSACLLIGPFLYLYVRSMTQPEHQLQKRWAWYLAPFILGLIGLEYAYPASGSTNNWGPFVELIYKVWILGILASAWQLRPIVRKLGQREAKLADEEKWLLHVFGSVAIVYLAYETSSYTSYLVGAVSFSCIVYLTLLLWLYRRSQTAKAKVDTKKYANSTLDEASVQQTMDRVKVLMEQEKLYLDPQLTLSSLSDQVGVSSKSLSQTINQSTGENYSRYVAKLRVEAAQRMLGSPAYQHYKIAAIAYESGFNSLSSFNAAFKQFTGMTALAYRKQENASTTLPKS